MAEVLFHLRPLLFAAILLPVAVLAAACAANEAGEARVLIIHSYDSGFRWTAEQERGIREGLAQAGLDGGVSIEAFEMETRVAYTTEAQIEERVAAARARIEAVAPELIFTTDDLALQRVAVPYASEGGRTPVIFSGVNGDPLTYGGVASLAEPGGTITGALERIPFAEALDAAKRVFPEAATVAILADDSSSSAAALAAIDANGDLALTVSSAEQISTFDVWQARIALLQSEVDVIAVLNYHRLRDDSGQTVPASEVAAWTLANSSVPVIGLVTDWVYDGLIMTAGNSGFHTGGYVAGLGAAILAGSSPGSIAIEDPGLTEIAFDLQTAATLGIEIPASEIASAAEVIR